MNSTTADLLARLGIDANALDEQVSFYRDRHPAAYEQGINGLGVALVGASAIFAADYESPNCPEGWDTLWSFIAKTEPELLALMDYEASASDEGELANHCKREGIEPLAVPACSWLVREGVFEALAYPTRVLKAYVAGGVR